MDVIITDPPFFDNVHYAELADFFYVWQQLYFDAPDSSTSSTTRQSNEVQDADVEAFARKLTAVFAECYRVLRDNATDELDSLWKSQAETQPEPETTHRQLALF